jgi:hypothetical protein
VWGERVREKERERKKEREKERVRKKDRERERERKGEEGKGEKEKKERKKEKERERCVDQSRCRRFKTSGRGDTDLAASIVSVSVVSSSMLVSVQSDWG